MGERSFVGFTSVTSKLNIKQKCPNCHVSIRLLLVADFAITLYCKNNLNMTETMTHGCSSEGTQQDPSNEYQHYRVKVIFKNPCIIVLWTKVSSTLEGLIDYILY